MATAVDSDSKRKKMIRILFPRGISDFSVELKDSHLTCEDVKLLCIEKLRLPCILTDACVEEGISSDILAAFGLVKSENESKWLLSSHVFQESDTQNVYKFKLRHRPPSSRIYVEGNLLSEFFVLQALDDFLKGELGKSMVTAEVSRDTILQLVLYALLLPSSLPLRNSEVIDKNHKINDFSVFSYKKHFSKEIYNKIITTKNLFYRLIDRYCYYTGLRDALKARKGESATVLYYKKEFINLLFECYPSYCFERYTVIEADDSRVEVKLVLYNEPLGNKQQTGIFINEVRQCALEEIDSVTLKDPDKDGPRQHQWLVEINCKGPKTQDKALLFDEKDIATSFITMLQGYMTLCVRPDINICRKLSTPSFQIRENLRSFCSMTHSAAVELLRNENRGRREGQECKFLIYENVDVLSDDRFLVATDSCEPASRIRYLNENGFQLYSSSGSEDKSDHFALRKDLSKLYGQPLRPDFVLQKVNPKSLFYLEKTEMIQASFSGEFSENGNTSSYILEEDLGPEKGSIEHYDKHLKLQVVPNGDGERLKVSLVASKAHFVEALFTGMAKLGRLYRLHPKSILGFYGTVFTQNHCNTYVLEHSVFGDLTCFLTGNKGRVTTCQKMKFAYEVAKIFCTLTQRETTSSVPLLHGNLRGSNFWVLRKHGRYFLKLGHPGLVSYYNTLDLKKPNNDQRIPWLSPERQTNLEEVTIASECYAVATTIAEIFHGTDDFKSVLQKLGPEHIREWIATTKDVLLKDIFSNSDFKFPHPEFPSSEDDAVTKSVRDVTLKLWDTLTQCWHSDPKERPSPLDLKNQIHDLEQESSCIVEDTVLGHFRAVLKHMHQGNKEEKDRISRISSMKECEEYLKETQGGNYVSRRQISIIKELGKGHYGQVFEGELTTKDGRTIDVAIKFDRSCSSSTEADAKKLLEFTKEFKTSVELDHPNIVKTLHWTKSQSYSFGGGLSYGMIMEKMNCDSLLKYASKNGASMCKPSYIKGLLKLSLDVAKGMGYCEAKGVAHCDLAARNVLLNRDAVTGALVAKVSDFGLAKILQKEKEIYYEEGSIARSLPIYWYAPEYLAFERDGIKSTGICYTTAGDIWAYGTTLWELFSKGKGPNEVFRKFRSGNQEGKQQYEMLYDFYIEDQKRWPKEEYMSDDIYEVMLSCWHENPDGRPRFAEIQERISELLHQGRHN